MTCNACKKSGATSEARERQPVIYEPFLREDYAKVNDVPWVRVAVDPDKFDEQLAEARRKIGPITESKKAYQVLRDKMTSEDQEIFVVVMLDTQLQLRGVAEIARGERDTTPGPIPDILRIALLVGAMAIIVSHNHPSGKSKPSQADKDLTKAIQNGCDAVGIAFFDHIVVGKDDYVSFRKKGWL